MFSRRNEIAVGMLALSVAAVVNAFDPGGWATLLSWVLTGMTIRFVSLPTEREAPARRTGSLLAVPFVVGILLILVGDGIDAKARTAHQGQALGTILLSLWVVLGACDARRNRRLDLAEAVRAAAEADAAAR